MNWLSEMKDNDLFKWQILHHYCFMTKFPFREEGDPEGKKLYPLGGKDIKGYVQFKVQLKFG